MVESSAKRHVDGSSPGAAPTAAHVVETSIRSLEGAGFDLGAAAREQPHGDDVAILFEAPPAGGLLSRITQRRRSASRRRADTARDRPATISALREGRDPLLMVVHRTGSGRTGAGKLIREGADIVVSEGRGSTTIKRSGGHPLIHLSTTVPRDAGTGARDEALEWTVLLRREPADDRLSLRLAARAVSPRGTRALAEEEATTLYCDALLRTSLPRLFLEQVDGWADADAGHLTIDLGPAGEFSPRPRSFPTARPGWVDDRTASFTADPALLATPRIIRYELERRGYTVDAVTANYLLAEKADSTIGYFFSNSHRAPQTAVRAAADKGIARTLLSRAGVPVADGRFFSDRTDISGAETLLRELGSIVVKPVDAGHGNGVSVAVTTSEALRTAWELAFDTTRSGVVVERHVAGVEARFMVVDDTCVSVTCARPPRIVGDGTSTVRDLINGLNTVRSRNPLLANRPVLLDEERVRRMREHGISPLTVLPAGRGYDVATDTSWYGGTTTEDITDDVHPSHKEAAVAAVRAIPGLAVAGLDVIMTDYTRPAADGAFVVLEVNSQPGLGLPHFPMIGAARNPAGSIIDADLAPRHATAFQPVAMTSDAFGERPDNPHPATAALGRELEELGFDIDWLADDYLHAYRDGVATAVWKSYTTLSGKSAASAAQHPRVSHGLLSRAGICVPAGWKPFLRDADPGLFRNGREALDYARTLASPALQVANRDLLGVESADEEAFRDTWHRLSRDGVRGVVVAEVPVGDRAHVLVAPGSALAVRWVAPRDDPAWVEPQLDPTYLTVAERAADAFRGLDLAEVVMHLTDPGAPAAPGNYTVSAVRTSPDLPKFQTVVDAEGRNIYREIAVGHVDRLLRVLRAT